MSVKQRGNREGGGKGRKAKLGMRMSHTTRAELKISIIRYKGEGVRLHEAEGFVSLLATTVYMISHTYPLSACPVLYV